MKRKLVKALRVGLSMVLVLSMLVSLAGVAVAGNYSDAEGETINYVSLGDSMTNGYGLEGYDGDMGCYDYGNASYANLFAQWLENGGKNIVNHSPLAMSAMRAEDLHWLLEFDYTDEEAVALTDGDWDEAAWNAKFTTGDYWTYNEMCDDYRFAYAAAYILAAQGDEAVAAELANNARYKIRDKEAVIVAKTYQEAIKNADVISVGMGNGNFGVFMLNRIMEAIGFMGSPEDTMKYKVENAIRECPPVIQEKLYELIDVLAAEVEANLGISIDDGDDTTTTELEAMANTAVYTAVSFVLNYAGSIEAILQLNPDAEIIMVSLLNTYKDPADDTTTDVSIGDLLEVIYTPLNAFIAGLPTYMQLTGNGVYKDATFYYANAEDIECMVDVYGRDFYLEDGTSNRKSTTRDRFVGDIIGTAGSPGMIWGLLSGVELVDGVTLEYVTLDEICMYDDLSDMEKAAYAATNTQKAVSISVYLAFEDAIIHKAPEAAVTLKSVLGLGQLDASLFSGVMTTFSENIGTNGAQKIDTAAAVVAAGSGGVLDAETVKALVMGGDAAVEEAAKAIVKKEAEANASLMTLLNASGYTLEQFVAAGEAGALPAMYQSFYQMYLDGIVTAKEQLGTAVSSANMVCMLLALPETLSYAVQNETGLIGLLGLFSRCVLGHGLGAHPSHDGHVSLYNAVVEAYDNNHYAVNESVENLQMVLSQDIEALIRTITTYIPNFDEIVAETQAAKYAATHFTYAPNSSSLYVALGDGAAAGSSYADILAQELGVAYKELGANGLRVEDICYILSEEYPADAYAQKNVKAENLRQVYLEAIAAADFITVGANSSTFVAAQLGQVLGGKAPYEMDWSMYVTEQGVPYVEKILAEISAYLADAGLEGSIASYLDLAVESYAYGVAAYLCSYPVLLEMIHTINPDAQVVMVGGYNALSDMTIEMDGSEVAIGEILGKLVSASDLALLVYAMMDSEYTSLVTVPETETALQAQFEGKKPNILGYLTAMIKNSGAAMLPNEAGDAYIAQCILDAMVLGEDENAYLNAELPFNDVSAEDWFYEAVQYNYYYGIMNGTSSDEFTPGKNISRAEFVQVLFNLEGRPEGSADCSFVDVDTDDWFCDAVAWAADEGVVTGVGGGKFNPTGEITREQIALMLYRYAAGKGVDVSDAADLSSFPDAEDVSDWAEEAVRWAVSTGIINGKRAGGQTTLAPVAKATRAEIAQIMMNFCKNF